MSKTFQFFIWSGKKAVAFLVLTVALSVAIVGTTLAYIITQTDILQNIFEPAKVDIEINGNNIENKSDVDVYIRAAVVVNWVDDNGTPEDKSDDVILSTSPVAGTDYTLSTATGWTQGSDGFYYYLSKVPPTTESITLLNGVTQNKTKDGYTLRVQVLSSAIQATPTEAVVGAWTSVTGVDASGKLTIETTNP